MEKGQAPPPLSLSTKLKLIAGGIGILVSIIVILVICIETTKKDSDDLSPEEIVEEALDAMPIIDAHNNFPWHLREMLQNDLSQFNFSANLSEISPWKENEWTQTDLPKLREGHVGSQFWVALVDCKSQHKDAVMQTLEQIDVIKRLINEYSDDLQFSTSSDDIESANDDGKIASFLAVGGGHLIQSSLAVLRLYYELGVRYLSLTHDCSTPWATSGTSGAFSEGVSIFGWNIIEEMNRLGMMIDLSHASNETALMTFKITKSPVIFSHSGARDICDHSRNLDIDVLNGVKQNNGIVMVGVNFHNLECHNRAATIEDVAEHIDYIKNVTSIDHVGIGGNFDGTNETAIGLENPSKYPALFLILARDKGYTAEDLEKLSGRNFLRVFSENERIRDELQSAEQKPNQKTITKEDLIAHQVDLKCITENSYQSRNKL